MTSYGYNAGNLFDICNIKIILKLIQITLFFLQVLAINDVEKIINCEVILLNHGKPRDISSRGTTPASKPPNTFQLVRHPGQKCQYFPQLQGSPQCSWGEQLFPQ